MWEVMTETFAYGQKQQKSEHIINVSSVAVYKVLTLLL